MKKKKEETTEEVRASNAPVEPSPEAEYDFGLDPSTIWIGRDAMRRIMERAENAYYGYFTENPDDEPNPGLRQIEEFLHEFQSVSGVRLRLIFGPPDKPLHELDLSKVPSSQGSFDTDEVRKWVQAGAALIADSHDLYREAA